MSSSAAKSASKIQRITEAKCREWAARPTMNPLTGKPIEIDGPTYNALKERCLNKYNIALPPAAAGVFSRGNSPDPAAPVSSESSSASSASVETKNRTAGWKRAVPTTEAGALAIVDLIGKQIFKGIKALITAQNNDPVNGLKNFNVATIFKNLPYYRPYIDSINNAEIFDSPYPNIRIMRIEGVLSKYVKAYNFIGPNASVICGYTLERLRRLIDPTAPKVIVILHKVFTFIQSLPAYRENRRIQDVLNAIQPYIAEAQRYVDNLNLALLLRRARNDTNTLGADELTANIARLMMTQRPDAAVPAPAPAAQGGRRRNTKKNT